MYNIFHLWYADMHIQSDFELYAALLDLKFDLRRGHSRIKLLDAPASCIDRLADDYVALKPFTELYQSEAITRLMTTIESLIDLDSAIERANHNATQITNKPPVINQTHREVTHHCP